MPKIVNIAAYKLARLNELPSLRSRLRALCREQALKGTILLSPEGINLFVAGTRAGVDALLRELRSLVELADLTAKESFSDEQPFNRMLVKIKREIIAFGVEGVDPRDYTSKRLSPTELKSWLDAGKPVTLLDTRNDFEVETGTFANAVAIGVDSFRDFPAAAQHLPDELKSQPVVTFCTGGIRCEKAAPLLEREGFTEVYQLDGGILKYFEECGGEHYVGECFVFDKRVAVDPQLKPSQLAMCFVCQAILSPEEQASPKFAEGVCCPRCYRPPETSQAELLARRGAQIREATNPLPGSAPYDNVRPIRVPQQYDGAEVLDFLDAIHTRLNRIEWEEVCRRGELTCAGETVDPGRVVRAGERLLHLMPATQEPDVNAAIEILHEDDALVVVNKPAPLPMHPCGRFNRNTLSYILHEVYAPTRLRAAHRLDADTTGVVVLCKTRQIAALLHDQFIAGRVRKRYVARVHGHPAAATFECHQAIAIEPGPGGVRLPDEKGAPAATRFNVLRSFPDGTSLVEVQPLTGRTNQIRVHLWSLGHPILGDAVYLPDGTTAAARSRAIDDPPLCLHAASIEITHPQTSQPLACQAPSPSWAR